MLVEEYRLHAELFGGGRFLAFPVVTILLVAGGVWLLELTGTSMTVIVGGLYALVFFFGLQVGTIGLVGRDAMRDVLGDVTLLVFSARTLPISRRRLLGLFILKDVIYYVGLFLTPVVVGFLPSALAGGFTPIAIALLWVGVAGTFALGTAASLTLAGIGSRSKLLLLVVLLAVLAVLIYAPAAAISVTPYVLTADPTPMTVAGSALLLAVLLVVGPLLFEPTSDRTLRRVEPDRYQTLRRLGDGVTARSILEVHRSSGSLWKVAFSLGILYAVAVLLLQRLATATALDPAAGIAFGTLLGLGTFTTYNWVTQFDDKREYLRYPVSYRAIFRGKRRAFFVLSVPIGLGYLAVGWFWYPTSDLLLGVFVFPLVSTYVYGVTVYLTGLSPNELLFDTALFALYGVALAAIAVPLLVASLAAGDAPRLAPAFATGLSILGALVGISLARRAGNRWEHRLRTANS